MTDKLIEQIKSDRKAEAKANGRYKKYQYQPSMDTRHLPETALDPNIERQLRRMGRVVRLESRVLADAEALKAADEALEQARHALNVAPAFADNGATEYAIEKFNDLYAAYRKARENTNDQ